MHNEWYYMQVINTYIIHNCEYYITTCYWKDKYLSRLCWILESFSDLNFTFPIKFCTQLWPPMKNYSYFWGQKSGWRKFFYSILFLFENTFILSGNSFILIFLWKENSFILLGNSLFFFYFMWNPNERKFFYFIRKFFYFDLILISCILVCYHGIKDH